MTLSKCLLFNNSATNNGGAVLVTDQSVIEVLDCEFNQNSVQDSGGSLYVEGSSVSITNTIFAESQASLVKTFGSNFGFDPNVFLVIFLAFCDIVVFLEFFLSFFVFGDVTLGPSCYSKITLD